MAVGQRCCRSPSNGKVSTTSNTITGRTSGDEEVTGSAIPSFSPEQQLELLHRNVLRSR